MVPRPFPIWALQKETARAITIPKIETITRKVTGKPRIFRRGGQPWAEQGLPPDERWFRK